MTREQLEHAIRAACDIAGDSAVYVFGSQAILGQYPDAPDILRRSIEVDLSPVNRPELVDAIDFHLGEESQFHRTHGFYVHGLTIDAATLPGGWEQRAVKVADDVTTRGKTGLCLEVHDLAASKLAVFRDKDRDFVRVLLAERLVSPRKLVARLRRLPVPAAEQERLIEWVHLTVQELPGLE